MCLCVSDKYGAVSNEGLYDLLIIIAIINFVFQVRVGRGICNEFLDVAFLSSELVFSTAFLINCGMGNSLWTTICHKSVVGGEQDKQAPCKVILLQEAYFLCQSNLMEIITLLARMR